MEAYPVAPLNPIPARDEARAAVLGEVRLGALTLGALLGLLCPPHEGELVREVLWGLVASGALELGDDETYRLGGTPPSPPPAPPSSPAPQGRKQGRPRPPCRRRYQRRPGRPRRGECAGLGG